MKVNKTEYYQFYEIADYMPIKVELPKICRVCNQVSKQVFCVAHSANSTKYFCKPYCFSVYKRNKELFNG